MWKILISLAFCLGLMASPALAQFKRVHWASETDLVPDTRLYDILDKGRLLAKLAYAPEGAPGFLANQHREVIYFGAGIHFDPGTYFAAFPDLHPSGDPSRVLVLSQDGYWAFVRTHRLTWEDDLTAVDTERAKTLIETAPRILSLSNDRGAYLPNTGACTKDRMVRDDEALVLEAKPGFGIQQQTIENTAAPRSMVRIPGGWELTRAYFLDEASGQTIEILDRRQCGWERHPSPYWIDVVLNGETVIKLDPEAYAAKAYPYDRSTNRAVISCARHRDSYFDYLIQELEVPVAFAPLIASMSGRWHSFEWFDDCGD